MKVIAVDLDETLVVQESKPLQENIDRHNLLFEDPNNFIVIYTARSYSIFHSTRELLLSLQIKHHAFVMEKIRATYYIDDKSKENFL